MNEIKEKVYRKVFNIVYIDCYDKIEYEPWILVDKNVFTKLNLLISLSILGPVYRQVSNYIQND